MIFSFRFSFADVAQLVERVHGKDEVAGSIPAIGSNTKTPLGVFVFPKAGIEGKGSEKR